MVTVQGARCKVTCYAIVQLMKLHRAGKEPDWALIDPAQRNYWQRLAQRTAGVITPGNFFTILGFIAVVVGFIFVERQNYTLALLLILSGRLCDLVDGWIADKTSTKSPLGEMLDPTVDKFATLIALIVLVMSQIVPLLAAAGLLLVNLLISGIVLIGVRRKAVMHASRSGKLGMAWAWGGLCLYVLAASVHSLPQELIRLLADAAILVTMLLSIDTIRGYYRDVFSQNPKV